MNPAEHATLVRAVDALAEVAETAYRATRATNPDAAERRRSEDDALAQSAYAVLGVAREEAP